MHCDDDFFGDEVRDNDDATSRKVSSKLFNDGYRIGKGKEEELQMQIGFDQGFERGMILGRVCGKLYAACRLALLEENITGVEFKRSIDDLEALLFERVSNDDCVSIETINSLRSLILSISIDLEPAFEVFESDVSKLST